jgi:arylesterase / paraoxonase
MRSSSSLLQKHIINIIFRPEQLTVGYCHRDSGCKIAINHMSNLNGITKSPWNDTYYVANSVHGGIAVLSRQADNRLVLDDEISSGL